MDIKIMLEKFASAVPIALSVYKGDTVVTQYNEQSFSNHLSYQMMKPYFDSAHNVCFLITPDFLQCGFIRMQKTDQLLIVGPASPYEPTPRQADNFLKSLKLPLSKRTDILSWFHHLPIMNMKEFRDMLDFLNYIINGTTDEPVRLSYHVPLINMDLKADNLAFIDSFTKDAEAVMLPLIEQGRYNELESIFNNLSSFTNLPNLASNATRSLKNAFISSTAIASRAAVKGGLDYDTALSLSNYYISKMEKLTLFADINQLLRTMLLDYTKRTANLQALQTDSATVTAVCRYVNEHLSERISAKDTARALHLSEAYICHHFKEKTGMNLSDYISMQKIKEARFLLETTELPLSVIAEKLAFSSQQYFQTVFKKYAGMTPLQYRRRTLPSAAFQ